jgi:hypothetical protein
VCRRTRERTYPFEPRRTKIPLFGISKLKSAMAVTSPLELNIDVLKVLFKFLMDMAILSSMECVWALLVRAAESQNFKFAFGDAWRAS